MSIAAVPEPSTRLTSMSAMFTPALPSSVPTVPITPGRSSFVTITMWSAGGTSNGVSSMLTMRCSLRRAGERAADRVAAAADREQVDVVGRRGAVDVAHLDAVLLGQLRGVDVGDGLVGDRPEEALQHGELEDARVVAGDVALGADLEHLGQLAR